MATTLAGTTGTPRSSNMASSCCRCSWHCRGGSPSSPCRASAWGRKSRRLSAPWRQLADFFSLWSRFYSLFERRFLTRVVLVVMAFLGLFGPLYSAVFLMNEHGVPVWNSPAEAMLFLASGIGVAAAMMLGLMPLLGWIAGGQWLTPRPYHRWTAVIAFALCGTDMVRLDVVDRPLRHHRRSACGQLCSWVRTASRFSGTGPLPG